MIVIDTHALIWSVQDDPRLGKQAARTIEAAAVATTILVPAICAWEVAHVEASGKVRFPGGALNWIRRIFDDTRFTLAPLEPEIAIESVELAWDHKDPADRMMVATARYWKSPLVTADEKILAYAAAGHVLAVDARR